MILYRGTPEPEDAPRIREYSCVFFTKDFHYASEYAVGARRGPKTDSPDWESGFVQKYRLPKQRLFIAESVLPRDKQRDPGMVAVFTNPDREWLEFLVSRGYTGTSMENSICIFDVSGAEFLGRWRVWRKYTKSGRRYWIMRQRQE